MRRLRRFCQGQRLGRQPFATAARQRPARREPAHHQHTRRRHRDRVRRGRCETGKVYSIVVLEFNDGGPPRNAVVPVIDTKSNPLSKALRTYTDPKKEESGLSTT